MRIIPKYLLAAATSIAITMAALFWVNRSFGPDPRSEKFELLNSQFSPDWHTCDPKVLNSTIVCARRPFVSPAGYTGASEIAVKQDLFNYHYRDFFGNKTFRIQYSISGHSDTAFTDYCLTPVVSGGGNVKAAAEITTRFDAASRTIFVNIHQQFTNFREAKRVSLVFQWNGQRFVAVDQAGPGMADAATNPVDLVNQNVFAMKN